VVFEVSAPPTPNDINSDELNELYVEMMKRAIRISVRATKTKKNVRKTAPFSRRRQFNSFTNV